MRLSDTLEEVLQSICDCLDECGFDQPACRLVSHCPPPVDCCDLLAVYTVNQVPSDSALSGGCLVPVDITIGAQYWFCVPVIDLTTGPSGQQIIRNYEEVEDRALCAADIAMTVSSGVSRDLSNGCEFEISPGWLCLPPSGGCGGYQWTWTLRGVLL